MPLLWLQLDDLLRPGGYTGGEAEVVAALEDLPDGAWALSDEPGLVWRAGRRTTDDLVDPSMLRVRQGRYTEDSARGGRRRSTGLCGGRPLPGALRQLPGPPGAAGARSATSWSPATPEAGALRPHRPAPRLSSTRIDRGSASRPRGRDRDSAGSIGEASTGSSTRNSRWISDALTTPSIIPGTAMPESLSANPRTSRGDQPGDRGPLLGDPLPGSCGACRAIARRPGPPRRTRPAA